MREHMGIFRGKRKSDGIWVEGCLFIDDKKEKYEILVGYTNYRIAWEVDPDTVGECTGLTDKNGKLIFEGDVVEDASIGLLGDIVFSTVGVPSFGINDIYDGLQYHDTFWSDLEIIGTVHDNPELLKGGEG